MILQMGAKCPSSAASRVLTKAPSITILTIPNEYDATWDLYTISDHPVSGRCRFGGFQMSTLSLREPETSERTRANRGSAWQ